MAEAVAKQFEDTEVNVVQMSNHGQVVVGEDLVDVVRKALFFEQTCEIYTLSKSYLDAKPDIEFLLSFAPYVTENVLPGQIPMDYVTGTEEGDIKIKNRIDAIRKRWGL